MSDPEPLSDSLLLAYADDALPEPRMVEIEMRVRSDSELADRLAALLHQRESGSHSIGDIWRRHRLSCPSREELGSYLLRALPDEHIQWIRLHLEKIGCRCCQSNLEDLRLQSEADNTSASRRQRIFQSSVGRLP